MTSALANHLHQHSELCWSGAVTVDRVVPLRHGLLEALLQSRTVCVDLAETAKIDLAALQLLCAAQRVAVPQGKAVQLLGTEQPPVAAALRLYGFRRSGPCCRDCGGSCLWLAAPEITTPEEESA